MDAKEIERLRKLCEGASKGPWQAKDGHEECDHEHILDADGNEVCFIDGEREGYDGSDAACEAAEKRLSGDRDFVCAARTALPALLDENAALKSDRDAARAGMARAHGALRLLRDIQERSHAAGKMMPTCDIDDAIDAADAVLSDPAARSAVEEWERLKAIEKAARAWAVARTGEGADGEISWAERSALFDLVADAALTPGGAKEGV